MCCYANRKIVICRRVMKMKFNSLIPELSVSNIENSIEFYTSIGFRIMYERKEDKFCFLELEKNQIMIEQINDNSRSRWLFIKIQ